VTYGINGFAWLGALALLASAPSCALATDEPVAEGHGLLTVAWTIEGATNPDDCSVSRAHRMDVYVTDDADGRVVGEFTEACDAFGTSIQLPPGRYSADSVLLDPMGHERTSIIELGSFEVRGDDRSSFEVDFPPGSFHSDLSVSNLKRYASKGETR